MSKLLQISIEVNSGSVGRIAEQIGEIAISEGWDSYITYARRNMESKSHLIQIGSNLDVYWHGIMTRLFDRHCLHSISATRRLVKQIQQIKPDIILLHHIHGYFLNMEILFNYLSEVNTPIVWIFHDCWSMTGHCAYFDYIGCDKWKNLCCNCPQKASYPASLFLDRSKKNYLLKKQLFTSVKNMTIIPVSYWLDGILKNSFLKEYPIHVIQNGINLSVFQPYEALTEIRNKCGIKDEKIILGVASTWDQRKGLEDFIRLNKILPNNYRIVLVGLTKRQIQTLPSNILGIQRTENVTQLAQLYSFADVFVNPTWEDTFPTTNLEALACGTPVITYRTGGSVESVTSSVGLVVDKGDVTALCDAIKTIVSKGKGYFQLNCRAEAEKNYDKNECFKKYIKLFNSLLNNK